ncbi:MAG: hypothetical protein HKP61_08840 [Dactylosporangium sp.]|nr:hypothetical protein [Dactylosporangium sp.]NNJ61041.1 hypothetical protein [Dactylosporangium sp.]
MKLLKRGIAFAAAGGIAGSLLVGSPAFAVTSCASTSDGHGKACVNTVYETVTVYDRSADGYSVVAYVTVGGYRSDGYPTTVTTTCTNSNGSGTSRTCSLNTLYNPHWASWKVYTADFGGEQGGGIGSTGYGSVDF